MSESVNLPALGESVTEGTVTRWLKQVGDQVEVDEPLLEVSTDKVDTEIPSPIAGVIEAILVQEDETVEVGTALVTIGDGSGGGDEPAPEQQTAPQPEDAAPAAPQPAQAQPDAASQSGEGYETPSPETEAAPAAQGQESQQQADPAQQQAQQEPVPGQPAPSGADAQQQADGQHSGGQQDAGQQSGGQQDAGQQADAAPAATPASPDPSAEAEVPSTDAPQPQEQAAPDAPAPAEQIDPAPAAESAGTPIPAQGQAPMPEQSSQPQQSDSAPAAQAAGQAEPSQGAGANDAAGYITPIVRKLAHERGVDLSTLTGTGVGGRIRKQDVLDASSTAPAPSGGTTPAAKPKLEVSPLRGTTVSMSRLRKVVAERAVVSMQSTAQLTSVVEVDVTAVAKLRDEVKQRFHETTGTKLSFLPFFGVAAAEALKAYPIINATVDGDSIVYPASENISIAVDTDRGLLTPVVRDAGELDIAGFAKQIADLAERTRDNKLKPDELAGGTFTLTNTGSRGALFDTPLVFLPQVAILGTGIVTKRPVVVGGDAIAIRSMVYLALSYDHRIVDGADAARFLVAVKDRLESGDFRDQLGI